jgi:predicted acyltransferase
LRDNTVLRQRGYIVSAVLLAIALPLILAHPAAALSNIQTFAADAPEVTKLTNFLKSLTQILTGIGTFVAALFIVYGGITYTTSSGNPERMDKAKRTIIFAVVGLVICVAGYSIATFFGTQAQQAFGS